MKIKIIIIILILLFVFSGKIKQLCIGFAELNMCVDIGICKEGLSVSTEDGRIIISKENCLKYGWVWDEGSKSCNTRDQSYHDYFDKTMKEIRDAEQKAKDLDKKLGRPRGQ